VRRPAGELAHLLECARLVTARAVGLEVVFIPVSDVDRAKQFYSKQLGFNVDNRMGESFRNVQLTLPGSACSVTIGTGLTPGLQLVVGDIQAARAELVEWGVEVSAVQHIEEGVWVDGPGGPWNSFFFFFFFFFKDPDGNDWARAGEAHGLISGRRPQRTTRG
jgi:catechol 2,3-dioxygenase-like lactoylglutathione lyase family enzyme